MSEHPTAVLSYARIDVRAPADKEAVLAIIEGLEHQVHAELGSDEFELWRDIDGIRTGDNWREALYAAIGRARVLIVLLSPGWLRSDECWREFQTFCERSEFREGRIVVYPALLRDINALRLTVELRQRLDTLTAIQRADWRELIQGPYAGRAGILTTLLRDTARDLAELIHPSETESAANAADASGAELPEMTLEPASVGSDAAAVTPNLQSGSNALVHTGDLTGHGRAVNSAAFSPDGRWIVTGSWDRTARVWDAATGAKLRRLEGHGSAVFSAAFSPDGRWIVTGLRDGTARVWDAATGAELRRLEGHGGWVRSAAFSPDGRWIVTGSDDRTARVWDAASGAELRRLAGHGGRVWSAAFSPDGRWIVTGSNDGTARVWDAASGGELRRLEGHQGSVLSAAFSPDGLWIVTGSRDGTARVWDAATGAKLRRLAGHGGRVWSAAFSPDGRWIVTGSEDGIAQVWDAASGAALRRLEGHGGVVYSAAFSPDGRWIVTGSRDGTARVWDAATGVP